MAETLPAITLTDPHNRAKEPSPVLSPASPAKDGGSVDAGGGRGRPSTPASKDKSGREIFRLLANHSKPLCTNECSNREA